MIFFLQAEDGIRDGHVTGVQTCALPIFHRIPVSHKGHLITGPAGSGKSSLLDGIAAVLTPDKWLRFNVAAQTAGARLDQRSLVSYVRGAWTRTADSEEDRVVSKYLRPRATWSGIILRYDNGSGRPLSLARLDRK